MSDKAQILVCGYYGRYNYGDEAFIAVLSRVWKHHNLVFRNLEYLEPEDIRSADLVVLGGGDLLQNYFLDIIASRVLPYKRCPIYAVGVSMPYASALQEGKLDMIDAFWCRFQSDVELLRSRFGEENVHYIPDLALLHPMPLKQLRNRTKRVGLCLSRSLVKGPHQAELLQQIGNLVMQLLVANYEVCWLAFNTDQAEHESDVTLYQLLPASTRNQIRLYSGDKLLPLLVEMDLVIASRFHAHVFSLLAEVPVISLVLTRKIQQWNLEHQVDRMSVSLPRNCGYPNHCETNCRGCQAFLGHVVQIPVSEIMNRVRLSLINRHPFRKEVALLAKTLEGIVKEPWRNRATAPYYIPNDLVSSLTQELTPLHQDLLNGKREIDFVASAICLRLTGNDKHPFHYGLTQSLTKPEFRLSEALAYMVKKFYEEESQWVRSLAPKSSGLFALNKIPPNRLEGDHRSGWQYVVNLLGFLHNPDAPIIDTFVDKTFGWHADYLEALNLIPYQQPWVGFLHHPGDAVYSQNDCQHLIQRRSFQDSLGSCKALFVMASSLKDWLVKAGIQVPIHVVYHPTEMQVPKFHWRSFENNPLPKVVQIGAWLRDPYAIFRLEVPTLHKALLKCRDMAGYLSAGPVQLGMTNPPQCLPTLECGGCRDTNCVAPFLQGVQSMLNQQWESVEILEHLSNETYDELLTSNIVFVPLLEAVAVNTILECIVRETPIVVKKLPAVVEYLGPEYPLYYSSYYEAESKLGDRDLLRSAHRYLKKMDKTFLKDEYFLASLRIVMKQ